MRGLDRRSCRRLGRINHCRAFKLPTRFCSGYPPTEPFKPKPRARQPNVIDDEADAVRDMVDEAIIGAIDANAADDNAVHDLMATVPTNVIEGPPPLRMSSLRRAAGRRWRRRCAMRMNKYRS